MDILTAFVAGIVATVIVRALMSRRRPAPAEALPATPPSGPAAEPAPPAVVWTGEDDEEDRDERAEPDAQADGARSLIERLKPVGEGSNHPSDLADNPVFTAAVREFEQQPLQSLIDQLGGDWMVGSAALAALARRDDREAARSAVWEWIRFLHPWPLYLALEFLKTLKEPPSPSSLVTIAPPWWAENPLIPGWLSAYFAFCAKRGISPLFGEHLEILSEDQVTLAEKLLGRVSQVTAQDMLREIADRRRSRVDRAYLQGVGRIVEIDAAHSLLIEHAGISALLRQAETAVLGRPHRSLLVVGERGWGKASFLTLLALRAKKRGWTIFEATGPQVQAGQVYIGELEERLRRLTAELHSARRVIWYVPDFVQLVTSGTHKGQSASLFDQIMPAVASGNLVLMSGVTPGQLTGLLQQRPGLRTIVELIRMRELSDGEANELARQVADLISQRSEFAFEPGTFETALQLSRHYLGSGGMPGTLIDLIKMAVKRAETSGSARLTRDHVIATLSQLSGMPKDVLDDRQRMDLASVRAFFSSRLIGQGEAIDAIVDRIAMLKAGLTDPGKPVGVFLFAGPTGTGKTELAKTLASFLFGSDERLIRLDMSEFQTADAVRKIIGDPGLGDTQSLTDLVRRQPFSVVLLDEFEKSHPNIWDLFLQVFDDGRLTDANGQTVDFRHCIVILTSNLGSTIRQAAGPGFVDQDHALSVERVMKAIGQAFRPEFINRLDRILIFRPLSRDDMRRIAAKELAGVLERRGLRHREWAVEWEPSALEFLLDKGFSQAMGARPLKRAIDEFLLAPLAATLVEHRFPEGDQFLFVRSDGRGLQVEFVDPHAPAPRVDAPEPESAPAAAGVSIPRIMLHPTGAADEWTALSAELATLDAEVASERWTSIVAELAGRMQTPDFWNRPDRVSVLSRFEVMDRVKAAVAAAGRLAARVERSADTSRRYSRELTSRLASLLFVVRHGIEDALTDAPVEAAIGVQVVLDRGAAPAEAVEWGERLIAMYRSWAALRGMRVEDHRFPNGIEGFVASGFGAWRLLSQEAGLHVLEYGDPTDPERAVARVMVAETPARLVPAPGQPQVVRRYQLEPSALVRDARHGWRTGHADLVLKGHFDVMRDVAAGSS